MDTESQAILGGFFPRYEQFYLQMELSTANKSELQLLQDLAKEHVKLFPGMIERLAKGIPRDSITIRELMVANMTTVTGALKPLASRNSLVETIVTDLGEGVVINELPDMEDDEKFEILEELHDGMHVLLVYLVLAIEKEMELRNLFSPVIERLDGLSVCGTAGRHRPVRRFSNNRAPTSVPASRPAPHRPSGAETVSRDEVDEAVRMLKLGVKKEEQRSRKLAGEKKKGGGEGVGRAMKKEGCRAGSGGRHSAGKPSSTKITGCSDGGIRKNGKAEKRKGRSGGLVGFS